jgi:hypothetical protein
MISHDDLNTAKRLWQLAHDSAAHAHECWRLLNESKKALIDSYRQAGFPFTETTREFEKLMEDHVERHQAALHHGRNRSVVCQTARTIQESKRLIFYQTT